jgi:hypothetical protein
MIISPKKGGLAPYTLAVAFVAIIGYLIEPAPMPADIFGLGVLIVAVSLLPMFDWIRSGSSSIPMFGLIAASFGLQFGFAVFSQTNSIIVQSKATEIPWEYVRKAQCLALLGIASMILSFWLVSRSIRGTSLPKVNLPLNSAQRRRLLFFCLVCWSAGWALNAFGFDWLGGINRLLGALPLLALAVMSIGIYKNRQNDSTVGEKVTLFLLIGGLSYMGLGTTMLESFFIPLVIFLIIRTAKTRRISLTIVVLGFLGMSVLNGIKIEVRSALGDNQSPYGSHSARWVDVLKRADASLLWKDDVNNGTPAYWRTLLDRFGLLNRFGWVCMNTPSRVPYFEGETYKYFLYAPVPRFLWRGKPIASDSNATLDYAYMLRSVSGGDTYVIGIGYIPEAYANFSWMGVALVLLIQGGLFGVFNEFLNGERSEGGAAVFILVTANFINGIGATSVMLFGNIVQIILCCVLIVYAFGSRTVRTGVRERARVRRSPAGLGSPQR